MCLCSQSDRFKKLALLSGTVLFLAFLKFPVIRVQPGFRRVGSAALMASPFALYLDNLADRLKIKRSKQCWTQSSLHTGNMWWTTVCTRESPSDSNPNHINLHTNCINAYQVFEYKNKVDKKLSNKKLLKLIIIKVSLLMRKSLDNSILPFLKLKIL